MSEPRKLRVFLCHSKGDKPKVRKLYKRLISDDFDAWLDEEKLLPGQDWDFEIQKAVRNADTVIVCLSKDSVTKEGYIQKEISYALDIADEKPKGTIFLIPVRIEECEVPHRIIRYQYIDLFSRKGYQKIIEALYLRMNDLKIRFEEKEIKGSKYSNYIKIPTLGNISPHKPIPSSLQLNLNSQDTIEIARELFPKNEIPSKLFALNVIGNSMAYDPQ